VETYLNIFTAISAPITIRECTLQGSVPLLPKLRGSHMYYITCYMLYSRHNLIWLQNKSYKICINESGFWGPLRRIRYYGLQLERKKKYKSLQESKIGQDLAAVFNRLPHPLGWCTIKIPIKRSTKRNISVGGNRWRALVLTSLMWGSLRRRRCNMLTHKVDMSPTPHPPLQSPSQSYRLAQSTASRPSGRKEALASRSCPVHEGFQWQFLLRQRQERIGHRR
jgi:hypothetical protein